MLPPLQECALEPIYWPFWTVVAIGFQMKTGVDFPTGRWSTLMNISTPATVDFFFYCHYEKIEKITVKLIKGFQSKYIILNNFAFGWFWLQFFSYTREQYLLTLFQGWWIYKVLCRFVFLGPTECVKANHLRSCWICLIMINAKKVIPIALLTYVFTCATKVIPGLTTINEQKRFVKLATVST